MHKEDRAFIMMTTSFPVILGCCFYLGYSNSILNNMVHDKDVLIEQASSSLSTCSDNLGAAAHMLERDKKMMEAMGMVK